MGFEGGLGSEEVRSGRGGREWVRRGVLFVLGVVGFLFRCLGFRGGFRVDVVESRSSLRINLDFNLYVSLFVF